MPCAVSYKDFHIAVLSHALLCVTVLALQMPMWVWTTLVFGGTLLIALICWLVYFKFFLAADDTVPSATAPPPDSVHVTTVEPQTPEYHGNFADAAARAAVAAAARATAAADKFFSSFGTRNNHASQTSTVEPSPPAPAAANDVAGQPSERGASDAADAESAPEGGAPSEEAGAS
jgi:hypothetical protein